ncbi:MAG TPA: ABC transporter permease [Gaiellales bacterium]|jgi:ABC-2 type transport system permease protein|nr:ABC transporter permease [Gaiellales bacterium]
MTIALNHSRAMALRHLRELWRQPWYVAVTLVQPIIWLLLFGALFKRVVEIPGFGGGDYIEFLTPGIVVMTAIFSAGWSGMGIINDLDRGVMDRLLVSPVRRGSLIAGRLLQLGITIVIQSVVVVGLALLAGARFDGGVAGVAVLIGVSVLLAWTIGALSIGFALVARREESLIGAVQFVILPATFLSSAFMKQSLAPGWIQDVAGWNPVDWAVLAGREALGSSVDWSLVAARAGYLAALAVACAWLAGRAFRAYQRSV